MPLSFKTNLPTHAFVCHLPTDKPFQFDINRSPFFSRTTVGIIATNHHAFRRTNSQVSPTRETVLRINPFTYSEVFKDVTHHHEHRIGTVYRGLLPAPPVERAGHPCREQFDGNNRPVFSQNFFSFFLAPGTVSGRNT